MKTITRSRILPDVKAATKEEAIRWTPGF
jgi:hypothetical protein